MWSTSLLPLLLLIGIIPAATAGIGPCIQAVRELTSRPSELFAMYQREICDRGCRPTVSHWDLWTRNNTYVPAVRSVTRAMGIPEHDVKLIRVGDDAAGRVREQCGEIIRDKNVCADEETLAAFGNCFKKQFVKVVMSNIFVLLPLVSEEKCKVQYDFVKDERLWDEIIPENMRQYADTCHELAEAVPVPPESRLGGKVQDSQEKAEAKHEEL